VKAQFEKLDRVRCDWTFALPLPETLSFETSGPPFCAGITVFNAMVQFGVKQSDRVGVIGIGGLGHLALQFLNKWGCDVHAFTSSDATRGEALWVGAHHVVDSRDAAAMTKIAGSLDLILSPVDVPLDWATDRTRLLPPDHDPRLLQLPRSKDRSWRGKRRTESGRRRTVIHYATLQCDCGQYRTRS